MSFTDFYALITKLYITLLALSQRAAIIHELVINIVKDSETNGMVIGINTVFPETSLDSENIAIPQQKKSLVRNDNSEIDDDLGSFADIAEFGSPSKSKANVFSLDDPSAAEHLPNSSKILESSERFSLSTYSQNIQESSDALFAACELSHIRCAKLLTIRSEQNVKLNSLDFFRLYGATWEFLVASEALCGRMCFPLKGCLLSQSKLYIHNFHEEKSKQISLLVENEQWVQCDIPIDFQHITEKLQLSKVIQRYESLSLEKMFGSDEKLDEEDNNEIDLTSKSVALAVAISPDQTPTPSPSTLDPGAKTLKFLLVDGQKYYVVISALMFIKTLTEYVNCAERLQTLVPEILNRIYELLKVSAIITGEAL